MSDYVELKGINKRYDGFAASKDVDLRVRKGSLTALLGPSGSGKTTILRIIAGLEAPDSGEIYIDGKKVNGLSPSERGVGFVFQSYALFRYMNVYDNIAFGLEAKKVKKETIRARVDELLELTELKGMEKRFPNQLSGGQRQRVAFARALAPRPSLLLLDEPFAAIDAKVRKELRTWLRNMIYKVGITSIFVTHDQDEAVEVADSIIVTNAGRVEQVGSPLEIYKHPQTAFVSQFIGEGTIVQDYGKFRGFSEKKGYQGAMIRPEFVEAFKSDNPKFQKMLGFAEKGVIQDIMFKGNCLELLLDVRGTTLVARRSLERRPVEVGEQMNVIIYRMFAFDAQHACLLENGEIQLDDADQARLDAYLYQQDGYFVA